MAAVLLALASAITYGTADFCGGLATRRAPARAVVTVSQAVGLVTLMAVLLLANRAQPSSADLAWGAIGGLSGMVGLVLFYQALASGVMSVVAPTTAITSAVVPVVVGVALGERLGAAAVLGIAMAIPAIALLGAGDAPTGAATGAPERARARSALLLAMAAGLGFGFFFVALSRTSDDGGLWPVAAARVSSVVALVLVAAVTRAWRDVQRAVSPLTVTAGVFDTTANVLFLLAAQRGLLAEVAVLASLYPASTILLARIVLHERLGPRQWLGVGLATLAVVAIAL